jgi:hypothetical protein
MDRNGAYRLPREASFVSVMIPARTIRMGGRDGLSGLFGPESVTIGFSALLGLSLLLFM